MGLVPTGGVARFLGRLYVPGRCGTTTGVQCRRLASLCVGARDVSADYPLTIELIVFVGFPTLCNQLREHGGHRHGDRCVAVKSFEARKTFNRRKLFSTILVKICCFWVFFALARDDAGKICAGSSLGYLYSFIVVAAGLPAALGR